MMILVLMALLVAFKFLDVNGWKYDMLRSQHSKSYITNNYVGFGEWLVFTKSIKEIGILLPIVNGLMLLNFLGFGGIFLLSARHIDVSLYLAGCTIFFAALCLITTAATIHNYSALGIGVKSSSASYGERVLSAVAFTAIICFFAYMKSRGVLF